MSPVRTDIRMRVIVVLSLACVLWFTFFTARAGAGSVPSDPSTSSSSTTATTEPTTTSTAAPTTTRPTTSSTRRTTTTTAPRASSTSTSSTTIPPTSTTVVEQAPVIVTDDTLPPRSSGTESSGLSTDTKLALVVGGLAAIGVLIGVLTFFYWRHTRPQRYMTALDALAEVEQKVPKDPTDALTIEQPAVNPVAGGTAAAGATTAVRILDAEDAPAAPNGDETVKTDPESVTLDEPTKITTVEDIRTRDAFEGD